MADVAWAIVLSSCARAPVPAGIYFFVVQTREGRRQSGKVVVVR